MASYTETVTYDLRANDEGVDVWSGKGHVGSWNPSDGLVAFGFDGNPEMARHCAMRWAKRVLGRDIGEPSGAAAAETKSKLGGWVELTAGPDVGGAIGEAPAPAREEHVASRRIVAMCGTPAASSAPAS